MTGVQTCALPIFDGNTENIMPLEPLRKKYEAFNWNAIEIDGNDVEEFVSTVEAAKKIKGKPTAIIAHTIPGFGVSFMENNYLWHGKPPNREEAVRALKDLRDYGEKLKAVA